MNIRILLATLLITLCISATPASAATSDKLVLEISDRLSLYVIPITISHDRYVVTLPQTAVRDTLSSTSLTYRLETPEGLRVKDGRAIGKIALADTKGQAVLYVLYEKVASSSRANTLAITGLPFTLTTPSGTTSTLLQAHELRDFKVSNNRVLRIEDLE
jgi:hypothetical protein